MKTDENILVPGRAALMVAKFERTMQPNLPVACVLGPVASPVASGVQKQPVRENRGINHLGCVTASCQPGGRWLLEVLGTVLRAVLHVDGLS